MTYAAGEAAILTLIQTLTAWDTNNSISMSNDATNAGALMMNSGAAHQYCILSPGPMEAEFISIGNTLKSYTWTTMIDIIVFEVNSLGTNGANVSAENALVTRENEIINKLDGYFEINNVASFGAVMGATEPETYAFLNGAGTFSRRGLRYVWQEERSVTQND